YSFVTPLSLHDALPIYFPAVKHVRQNVRERFWVAGHFERDIEPFLHAERLNRVGDLFRTHIQRQIGSHFAREIETIGIHIGNQEDRKSTRLNSSHVSIS